MHLIKQHRKQAVLTPFSTISNARETYHTEKQSLQFLSAVLAKNNNNRRIKTRTFFVVVVVRGECTGPAETRYTEMQ